MHYDPLHTYFLIYFIANSTSWCGTLQRFVALDNGTAWCPSRALRLCFSGCFSGQTPHVAGWLQDNWIGTHPEESSASGNFCVVFMGGAWLSLLSTEHKEWQAVFVRGAYCVVELGSQHDMHDLVCKVKSEAASFRAARANGGFLSQMLALVFAFAAVCTSMVQAVLIQRFVQQHVSIKEHDAKHCRWLLWYMPCILLMRGAAAFLSLCWRCWL